MQRPRGVEITTWLMVFLLPLGLTYLVTHWSSTANIHIKPGSKVTVQSALTFIHIGYLVSESFSALCVVFYWKGRDWARILVLIMSCFSLYSVLKLPLYWKMSAFIAIEYLFHALLAVFLLWYLFQPDVRAWFREQTAVAIPANKTQPA